MKQVTYWFLVQFKHVTALALHGMPSPFKGPEHPRSARACVHTLVLRMQQINSLPAEMNEVIYFCVVELNFAYIQ